MSILGNRVLRKEDPEFLTGGATYVDDLRARRAPRTSRTCARRWRTPASRPSTSTTRGRRRASSACSPRPTSTSPRCRPAIPMLDQAMVRPFLADGVVRFVGEPVAVVVTEERYQGEDAAELVFVDYEPLPAVVDPEAAERARSCCFPDAGTNVALRARVRPQRRPLRRVRGRRPPAHRQPAGRARARSRSAPWRPRGATTGGSRSGRARQDAHGVKSDAASQARARRADQVRVIVARRRRRLRRQDRRLPRGARCVAWLARRLEPAGALGRDPLREHGRPGPRPGQVQQVELGGTRDGTVEAYRLTILQDAGAYPEVGAILPVHDAPDGAPASTTSPKAECNAESVVTNTTPIVAYRGAGRPEATAAIERAWTCSPPRSGMDPAEVRRRNLIAEGRVPVHDRGRHDLRQRRLRARARPRARGRRLRRRCGPSRRSAATRGDVRAARHRGGDLRRDHRGPDRRRGVRRGRGARPTARARPHRHRRRTGRATPPRGR